MKRYSYILTLIILFIHVFPFQAAAVDVFRKYEKVIWIDQERQVGAAYGHGRRLLEFPIITGDDETPTPPGTYVVKKKDMTYYSRKYDTPMPYSLFFDLKGMRAIHEGEVPDPEEIKDYATHGCIHVEQPYMKWLYDWAEKGKTVVVIHGRRDWDGAEGEEQDQDLGQEQGQEQDQGQGQEQGQEQDQENGAD